jgi:hypothetical protein
MGSKAVECTGKFQNGILSSPPFHTDLCKSESSISAVKFRVYK